ncbi:MAG: putative lipid II flippase FtsW [Syntrophales bacterium]|nr:putative lipid II flippase FtsW [Syntrophales bacterium]
MDEGKNLGTPDKVLFAVVLILIIMGTIMIYSSSSIMALERFRDPQFFLKKHLLMLLLFGFPIMVYFMKMPYEWLQKLAYPTVIISIFLLILVLIPPFGPQIGGAKRWLRLGVFSIQVSELAKVAVVLFMAHFLSRKYDLLKDPKRGIVLPLTVVLAVIFLILREPDFGTAVMVGVISIVMLYIAGCRLRYLVITGMMSIPFFVWLLVSKAYRLKRLTAFLDPWSNPHSTGFQIIQSFLSFGSGGTFGVGLGDGMQKLFYLPEPHTDFILAVVAEEMGFFGVAVVIILFGILVYRGFVISMRAPDLFGMLLASGLTVLLALEAFINIAGVMGLVPVKGLALPFMSYGGSSLVMSMAAVGMLLNISSRD